MSMPTISVRECQDRIAADQMQLLDVRTGPEFTAVHALPAKHAPLDGLPANVPQDRSASIALICKSGSRAAKGYTRLTNAGWTNVHVVEGGTDAWLAADLPVIRGESRVPSLERQVRIAAGLLVTVGVVLAYSVNPAWVGLSLFVGLGLIFAGVTDTCAMGMLIAKLPWNRGTTH